VTTGHRPVLPAGYPAHRPGRPAMLPRCVPHSSSDANWMHQAGQIQSAAGHLARAASGCPGVPKCRSTRDAQPNRMHRKRYWWRNRYGELFGHPEDGRQLESPVRDQARSHQSSSKPRLYPSSGTMCLPSRIRHQCRECVRPPLLWRSVRASTSLTIGSTRVTSAPRRAQPAAICSRRRWAFLMLPSRGPAEVLPHRPIRRPHATRSEASSALDRAGSLQSSAVAQPAQSGGVSCSSRPATSIRIGTR